MERNKYIKLCQIGAVDNSIKVKYNNIQYFPSAYMMQFDGAGNPVKCFQTIDISIDLWNNSSDKINNKWGNNHVPIQNP